MTPTTVEPTPALALWQAANAAYLQHVLWCRSCTAEHCPEGQRLHDALTAAERRLPWFGRGAA